MNTKNVNFGEDKLRIKVLDKKSFTGQGGTVSVMYEDISSLSVVKNNNKFPLIFYSIIFFGFGGYFYSHELTSLSPIFILLGLFFLLLFLITPKEHLGVETRGGSVYLANVPGTEIFEVIDEIEKRRKDLK